MRISKYLFSFLLINCIVTPALTYGECRDAKWFRGDIESGDIYVQQEYRTWFIVSKFDYYMYPYHIRVGTYAADKAEAEQILRNFISSLQLIGEERPPVDGGWGTCYYSSNLGEIKMDHYTLAPYTPG